MLNRPTMVDSSDGVRPAVQEVPVLATAPGTWNGFGLEVLRLPAGELPPHSTLLQHVICAVTSSEPVHFQWGQNGRDQGQTVHRGELILRSQQELIDFRWAEPVDVLVLGIGLETLRSVSADMPGASDCELVPAFGTTDPLLNSLMLVLREDLAAGCPTGRLLGEAICTSIAVRALQNHSVRKPRIKNYHRGLPAPVLKLVLEYIDAHLGDDLSITQLATLAGMGRHYFRKLFCISSGLTVHEYVTRARITRATHLLCRTHLSIVETALQVGFSSQSHFTSEFHRRVGITPAVYRSMMVPPKAMVSTA